jgi:hypothetical protein
VEFVVEKGALGQVFPQVRGFSPVDLIPPVLHYLEKWKTNDVSLHHHHKGRTIRAMAESMLPVTPD